MAFKILIMGLPGSGKTTLASELFQLLHEDATWLNADNMRRAFNDWDFSKEGRLRQAQRMRDFADQVIKKYIICDFIAPLPEMREIFDADYTVWVDSVKQSNYEDTDKIFVPPNKYDLRVTRRDAEYWADKIYEDIIGRI